MDLLPLNKIGSFLRVKHTFNADDGAEKLLQAAAMALNDKTEFINRCVREAGNRVLNIILDERRAAVSAVLNEHPDATASPATPTGKATTYKSQRKHRRKVA